MCQGRDSNSRPLPYEDTALPLSYPGLKQILPNKNPDNKSGLILLRGQELNLVCEIMLSVFPDFSGCRTMSFPSFFHKEGAWRIVSTDSPIFLNRSLSSALPYQPINISYDLGFTDIAKCTHLDYSNEGPS